MGYVGVGCKHFFCWSAFWVFQLKRVSLCWNMFFLVIACYPQPFAQVSWRISSWNQKKPWKVCNNLCTKQADCFPPFIRGRILYPTLQRWQALPLLMKIGWRWFGSSCLCWQFLQNYPTHHGPCNEGKEGGNEGHERSEGHDQGSTFGWVGHCYWYEEVRHHQSPQHIDWDRHPGGEEVWQVRSPGLVYDQDSPEGSYQRRHSDDVWARDEGQTTASKDCREGISCFSIEESNLRPCWAPHASGTLGVWSTTSISEAQPYVH